MSEEGGGLYRGPGALTEPRGHAGRVIADGIKEMAAEKDPWKHRSAGMRCRTCMFYVPKVPAGPISKDEAKIGRCRRNAPTMRGFPAVFPNDWCGEHRIDENRL